MRGCFRHGHLGCTRVKRPATNRDFWDKKLDANIEIDKINIKVLQYVGWKKSIIWTCETKDILELSVLLNGGESWGQRTLVKN